MLADGLTLAGKRCLITGGSRGLGLAIAQRFAAEGASITLVSNHEDNLKAAVSQLSTCSSQVHRIAKFDVGSGDLLTEQDIGGKLSEVDIVVNSAGISQSSLLLSTSRETIESLIRINLLGTIFVSQSFIKPMIRKRAGSIINIASVLALRGGKGSTVYSASKAGVIGFTKSLANELGSRNIRVNCLCVGLADTDMGRVVSPEVSDYFASNTPLNDTLITPSEVADAALYLALSRQITGTVLTVDAGFMT